MTTKFQKQIKASGLGVVALFAAQLCAAGQLQDDLNKIIRENMNNPDKMKVLLFERNLAAAKAAGMERQYLRARELDNKYGHPESRCDTFDADHNRIVTDLGGWAVKVVERSDSYYVDFHLKTERYKLHTEIMPQAILVLDHTPDLGEWIRPEDTKLSSAQIVVLQIHKRADAYEIVVPRVDKKHTKVCLQISIELEREWRVLEHVVLR